MKDPVMCGAFLALTLAFVGCKARPVPGETGADPSLQENILFAITFCEESLGKPANWKVVNTTVVKREGDTVTEDWLIKRRLEQVTYTVELFPCTNPEVTTTGTWFRLTPPENEGSK